MKRSEMKKLIKNTLDYEILDIPNDSYLVGRGNIDYSDVLLKKLEENGMVFKSENGGVGWDKETDE